MASDYKTLIGLVGEFVARYDSAPQDSIKPDCADLLERARAAIAPSQPKNDPRILHMTSIDDPCCSKHLHKAASRGTLDNLDRWQCPSCFCDWKMTIVEGTHYWQPVTSITTFKL